MAQSAQATLAREAYECIVLSSARDILEFASRLPARAQSIGTTGNPGFFLASIENAYWRPRVVLVSRGHQAVGIVYFKERKWARIPTGIVYADGTLNGMIFSDPSEAPAIFAQAIRHLLNRKVRALRISLPPECREVQALRELIEPTAPAKAAISRMLDVQQVRVENHAVLDVGTSYDNFLAELGSKTRRNFRYYRRRFEAAGGTFATHLRFEEFRRVAETLLEKSVVGASAIGVQRALGMFANVQRPILIGLRSVSGEWVAILGGWYELDRAIVFFQMNNERDYPESSLCLVLRGYFFEHAIRNGISKILFWAGVGEPLLRYAYYLPATGVYLDRRTWAWRATRHVIRQCSGFLPQRMRVFAHWLVPTSS